MHVIVSWSPHVQLDRQTAVVAVAAHLSHPTPSPWYITYCANMIGYKWGCGSIIFVFSAPPSGVS